MKYVIASVAVTDEIKFANGDIFQRLQEVQEFMHCAARNFGMTM